MGRLTRAQDDTHAAWSYPGVDVVKGATYVFQGLMTSANKMRRRMEMRGG